MLKAIASVPPGVAAVHPASMCSWCRLPHYVPGVGLPIFSVDGLWTDYKEISKGVFVPQHVSVVRCPSCDRHVWAESVVDGACGRCWHKTPNTGKPVAEVRVTDPVTGGQKGAKPEVFDNIPVRALEEVARVYGFGAKKYDRGNFLKGYAWSLSISALLRHIFAFCRGESHDPESGIHHLAHATFHLFALMEFERRGIGTDDRLFKEGDGAKAASL